MSRVERSIVSTYQSYRCISFARNNHRYIINSAAYLNTESLFITWKMNILIYIVLMRYDFLLKFFQFFESDIAFGSDYFLFLFFRSQSSCSKGNDSVTVSSFFRTRMLHHTCACECICCSQSFFYFERPLNFIAVKTKTTFNTRIYSNL